MAATVTTGRETTDGRKQAEHGFTLIEVMVSMVVLTIGLLSLLAVFGLAMAATQTSQQDMIAKQLANEALESIVTARNTAQLQWDQVQNVGSGSGIFVTEMQPINLPGADGIVGTADDATASEQTLTEPGPDGIYGTADDVQLPLSNYQRQVTISQVADASGNLVTSLRGINVTIQYTTPRLATAKTYVLSSYISQFR
ncbi:MAG TPA: prepilin-type N-terminal cleavage/methylation domain-containing protein [Terriglobales bacterium]